MTNVDLADLDYLSEMRLLLEGHSARLAAQRATPDDLVVLESLREEQTQVPIEDTERLFALDHKFHQAIAHTTGNKYLADALAAMEGTEAAWVTASGMAAISSVLLSILKPGERVIAHKIIYGSSHTVLSNLLPKYNIFCSFIDLRDKKAIQKTLDENVKAIYLETPANPTLDIIDIKMWKSVARKRKLPLIVDNTFATPYLQNPLSLGADIVIHSATKYLSGHSDALGGIIIGSGNMINRIREEYIFHYGPVISPFNAG